MQNLPLWKRNSEKKLFSSFQKKKKNPLLIEQLSYFMGGVLVV